MTGMSSASRAGIGNPCGQVAGRSRATKIRSSTSWGRSCSKLAGQPVGLVPGVAEHVGQEALDDAVAADGGHRRPPAGGGEHDAVVGPVVDEAPLGQALDGDGRPCRAPRRGARPGRPVWASGRSRVRR